MKGDETIMKKMILGVITIATLIMTAGGADALARKRDTGYAIAGTTLNVEKPASGTDISENLDNALDYARVNATKESPITVKVPAGDYTIGNTTLHIYSNTTLDVTGCHFKSVEYTLEDSDFIEDEDEKTTGPKYHAMCIAGVVSDVLEVRDKTGTWRKKYNTSEYCAGYDGFENITIKGGIWESVKGNTSTIIRLYHAKNVTLDGVTLTGGGCAHQIEVAAIDGFTVKDCTFKDYGDYSANAADQENQEALQLDVAVNKKKFKGIWQDGTMMKNVTVTGCTFKNVPRGVGTHSMLLGGYHENIKINNNTFEDIPEEVINDLCYRNCEIKDNVIKNCGAGILVQFFKPDTTTIDTTIFDGTVAYNKEFIHDASTVISGNTITTVVNEKTKKYCDEVMGIKLYGFNLITDKKDGTKKLLKKDNYYISGVTIDNNTINTTGFGVHLMDVWGVPVTNNTINGTEVSAIHIAEESKIGDVTGNKINNLKGEAGITVIKSSSCGIIKDNTIAISGNKVKETTKGGLPQGIKISQNSTSLAITDNKISDTDASNTNLGVGILVYDGSTVDGDISGNEMAETTSFGISASTDAVVNGDIKDNSLKDTGASGIFVYKGSSVGAITGNTIEKTGNYGIQVSESCTVGGAIDKNTMSDIKRTGIFIYKSSIVKAVTNNKISSVGEHGISVSTKCKVKGNIANNKVKGGIKTSGIFVKQSTITGSVSKNTAKNPKEYGIFLTDKAIIKGNIENNTFTSPKKKGIFLQKNSTVKAIKGNTVTGAGSHCINITSLANDLEISNNTVVGGKEHVIIIQPTTKKYKITLTGNKITADKTHAGIRVTKGGKVIMKKNTIKTAFRGIWFDAGIKATVSGNKFKGKVGTKIYSAGKEISQK